LELVLTASRLTETVTASHYYYYIITIILLLLLRDVVCTSSREATDKVYSLLVLLWLRAADVVDGLRFDVKFGASCF